MKTILRTNIRTVSESWREDMSFSRSGFLSLYRSLSWLRSRSWLRLEPGVWSESIHWSELWVKE